MLCLIFFEGKCLNMAVTCSSTSTFSSCMPTLVSAAHHFFNLSSDKDLLNGNLIDIDYSIKYNKKCQRCCTNLQLHSRVFPMSALYRVKVVCIYTDLHSKIAHFVHSGLAEKTQLLKLGVPATFMLVALDEGPGPPIKYQYAELGKLYTVVSQLVRCCDVTSRMQSSINGENVL